MSAEERGQAFMEGVVFGVLSAVITITLLFEVADCRAKHRMDTDQVCVYKTDP